MSVSPVCPTCLRARDTYSVDAIGRRRARCSVCDRFSVARQGSIPELRGRSQAQWAPPVALATRPTNRSALVVHPPYNAFVEVRERPAPLPSKYVKSEAETHAKDLPKDHPRHIAYVEKLSAARKATLARKRAERAARLRQKVEGSR